MALNLICESVGSGPPLVVLHGLFGSSGNWRGIARELADSHSVFASTCATTARRRGPTRWTTSRWQTTCGSSSSGWGSTVRP